MSKTELYPETLKHFGLTGKERGNKQVPCPFHKDSNASASINLKKELFHCFTCKQGWHLSQVEEYLRGSGPTGQEAEAPPPEPEPVPPPQVLDEDTLVGLGEQHLEARGLPADPDQLGADVFVDTEPGSKMYGYLVFQRGQMLVGRNLLDDGRPRYLNTAGAKDLFFIGDDTSGRTAWLAEGIFDATALHQAGVRPVAALLGCEVSDHQAYLLRRRTVFILLDADQPGWKGARAVAEKLREYEANPIIVELPEDMGKDPGEAFQKNRDRFVRWVRERASEYSATDEAYVDSTFSDEAPEMVALSTGIETWDDCLGGGFLVGAHVIGAEPGVGKTSYALRRLYAWAKKQRLRGLYLTYEIPKKQAWSRIASCESKYAWRDLEKKPGLLEPKVRESMRDLARYIRVGVGWDIGKIHYAAEHYDVIVIDYLQRMPGPFGGDATRQNIDHNVSRLSDLARDSGKVIIIISSLPRSAYNGQFDMKAFKESGGIEYVSQSATGLLTGGPNLAVGKIVKNTRGSAGNFWMRTDLGHLLFEETKPGNIEVADQMAGAFQTRR